MLLESDPVLDSPHGPNALVMRRSGVRIFEATPRFWLVFRGYGYILGTFFEKVSLAASDSREPWSSLSSSNSEA